MNRAGIAVSVGLALCLVPIALPKDASCRKVALEVGRVSDTVPVLRVFTGTDGKSHAEKVSFAAVKTTYLGLQLAHFDFGDPSNVVIVRGPPNFVIPFHAAPYREIFMVLSGGSTIELSDGTQHQLNTGDVVLFEDVTGPGHGGKVGSCGYVSLDLQFKPPAAAAVR
jgi:quercetin dioxygenase-like cupin family protein